MYIGSRKRQDLPSKLGAWVSCEKVEGEGGEDKGMEIIIRICCLKKSLFNNNRKRQVKYSTGTNTLRDK